MNDMAIYLDNNATTRPADEVVAAMLPYLTEWWGNPSSLHRMGQYARKGVDEAREQVATAIGCTPSELTFSGGGTESINTALRGLAAQRPGRTQIVTSSVEHAATRMVCEHLQKAEMKEILEINVDQTGTLDIHQFAAAVTDQTALVTIMWANSETGVLYPVREISEICAARGVPFHCDGTQAVGKLPVNVHQYPGLSAMSFASHKFHGPKGVGGLYVRRGVRIPALMYGGPQERNKRAGTENVAGVVGMGKAAELAGASLGKMKYVAELRDRLERGIESKVDIASVIGQSSPRLPNTTDIGFARLEAEAILLSLSEREVCASAGSACSSGSLEPSPVLRAMGVDPIVAHGAIRFSLSRFTTEAEIQSALAIVPGVISRLRQVLPVG